MLTSCIKSKEYLYSREHKSLTVDFRPALNRGGSPAWASMVEVIEETFCECTGSKFPGNNHETPLIRFNVLKRMAYFKKCCVIPPPQQRPNRAANMILRGMKILRQRLMLSTVLSWAKETAPFFQRGRISVGSSGFVFEEREAGKPWSVRHRVT